MNEATIFAAALDKATDEERAAYVAEVCRGDDRLRRRVEALLRAHAEPDDVLDPPSRGERTAAFHPVNTIPGTVIGPYKLVERIGEGGMGEVWLAQQQEPVKRVVALKLVKPGMDSRPVLARFEAERQALALMDHPNIAKVLDAGATPDGRPYFVMELVKGVRITHFCDERRLTPRQRLELFVSVCQAIQHAHQKGVIHRDIKPSNVLVALYDGKPVPKVIDFGVAKAAGQVLTDKTLVTGFGAIVGTLEYMSPEQAEVNQLDIDTRSDTYSLGVLLYELLTGSPPFTQKELAKAGLLEMLRVIREQEPTKPSTKLSTAEELPTLAANRGTEPARLTKLVRGELDWIVMKALEKDRGRRYESPSAFAADVQRYLQDEPVLACPPSTRYRLQKFLQRNKGPVLAATLIVLALVGGIIGTTLGMIRAEEARDAEVEHRLLAEAAARAEEKAKITAQTREAEAQASERKAKQREAERLAVLDFFLNKIVGAARPEGKDGGLGYDVSLRKALDASLPFVETSFSKQPLIEAHLRGALGLSFTHLGDLKMAVEQNQAAYALFTKHLGAEDPLTLASMNNLASSLGMLDRYTEALKLLEKLQPIYQAQLGPEHPDALHAMNGIASCYSGLGRYAQAIKLNKKILAVQLKAPGPDHPDTLLTMNNLANSYRAQGQYSDALEIYEDTLRRQKALGPYDPQTLTSMDNLATIYNALGRLEEALKLHEETLALRKRKLGSAHPDTFESMHNLASVYTRLARPLDAVKLLEEALPLAQAKLGPAHRSTLQTMDSLHSAHTALGRHADAFKLCEEMLRLWRDKFGPDHPETLRTMSNLATDHMHTGQYAEALKLYETALAGQKAVLDLDHPDTLSTIHSLANCYSELHRDAEALKLRQEVLKLWKTRVGPKHHNTLGAMLNLALSYRDMKRPADAAKLLEELLALEKVELGPEHPDTLQVMYNLANCYSDLGKKTDALKLRQETLALRKTKLGPNHPKTLLTMWVLANNLDELDRSAEALPIAEDCFKRALGQAVHPQLFAGVMYVRLHHFAKLKDSASCRQTAEMFEKLNRTDARSLYDAACLRAATAAVCKQDPKIPKEDAPRFAKVEAEKAMAWLEKAVAAGFQDPAEMAKDKELDALRDREDFKMLLAELKAKKPG
jgi:serine/threonine protein kinase/tetratricopeptide (TPR) repeat protein